MPRGNQRYQRYTRGNNWTCFKGRGKGVPQQQQAPVRSRAEQRRASAAQLRPEPVNTGSTFSLPSIPELMQSILGLIQFVVLVYMILGRELSAFMTNRTTNAGLTVLANLGIEVSEEWRDTANWFSFGVTAFVYLFATLSRIIEAKKDLKGGKLRHKHLALGALLSLANAWSTAFTTYGATAATYTQNGATLSDSDKALIATWAAGAGLYAELYYALSLGLVFANYQRTLKVGNNRATWDFVSTALLSLAGGAFNAYFGAIQATQQSGFKYPSTTVLSSGALEAISNACQVLPVVAANAMAQGPGIEKASAKRYGAMLPPRQEAPTATASGLAQPLLSGEEQAAASPAATDPATPANVGTPAPRGPVEPIGPGVAAFSRLGRGVANASNLVNSAGVIGAIFEVAANQGASTPLATALGFGVGVIVARANYKNYKVFRVDPAVDGMTNIANRAVQKWQAMSCCQREELTPSSASQSAARASSDSSARASGDVEMGASKGRASGVLPGVKYVGPNDPPAGGAGALILPGAVAPAQPFFAAGAQETALAPPLATRGSSTGSVKAEQLQPAV